MEELPTWRFLIFLSEKVKKSAEALLETGIYA